MSEGSQWWIVAAMLAPPIFLLYDHLLTLGMEVQYIWLKRKRRSAYWFFLLRYFASFGEIVMLVFRFYDAGSESGCLVLQTYINTHTLLVELLVAFLMSMRVYALYECSKRIMWLMIVVAGSLIPLVGWSVAVSSIGTALLQGMICGKIFPEQKASYLTVTWGCALAYDLTIFILTLWKTIKTRRCFRGSLPVRLPLLDIMLRDGVIYFGIMSIVHLVNVFLCAFRTSSMSALARTISATMTLRLMLNLHESASEGLLSRSTMMDRNLTSTFEARGVNIQSGLVFRRTSLEQPTPVNEHENELNRDGNSMIRESHGGMRMDLELSNISGSASMSIHETRSSNA